MLDIKFVKDNPQAVKDNIQKKYKNHLLPLVDQAVQLYDSKCQASRRADDLRANRNKLSKNIGVLMAQGNKTEANALKAQVSAQAEELNQLAQKETLLQQQLNEIMLKLPNMVDSSVPIGKSDEDNVEVRQYGEKSLLPLTYHIIRT